METMARNKEEGTERCAAIQASHTHARQAHQQRGHTCAKRAPRISKKIPHDSLHTHAHFCNIWHEIKKRALKGVLQSRPKLTHTRQAHLKRGQTCAKRAPRISKKIPHDSLHTHTHFCNIWHEIKKRALKGVPRSRPKHTLPHTHQTTCHAPKRRQNCIPMCSKRKRH
jgi:hypothetical protein